MNILVNPRITIEKWGIKGVYITRTCYPDDSDVRGATYDDFSGQFFRIFEIIIFCFVVAI